MSAAATNERAVILPTVERTERRGLRVVPGRSLMPEASAALLRRR
jgi:hypothetical protein